MLLILVLSRQKGRRLIGGEKKNKKKIHEQRFTERLTDERDRKEHLQSKRQSVVGSFSPHRNHTELLFRQCATRLSVAVLDTAFQVM